MKNPFKMAEEIKEEKSEDLKEVVEDFSSVDEEEKVADEDAPRIVNGYDIRWLKKIGKEHPDFYLVAEYEKEYGEIK